MLVKGIDHVNIIADDLEATAEFYHTVLGLRIERIAGATPGFDGRWLFDARGFPVIHLMAWNEARHAELVRGSATGSIDHVALACEDFAGMVRHCEALGIQHRVNDRKYGDLRQIFITDPNNVKLELNFAGD